MENKFVFKIPKNTGLRIENNLSHGDTRIRLEISVGDDEITVTVLFPGAGVSAGATVASEASGSVGGVPEPPATPVVEAGAGGDPVDPEPVQATETGGRGDSVDGSESPGVSRPEFVYESKRAVFRVRGNIVEVEPLVKGVLHIPNAIKAIGEIAKVVRDDGEIIRYNERYNVIWVKPEHKYYIHLIPRAQQIPSLQTTRNGPAPRAAVGPVRGDTIYDVLEAIP